MEMFCKIHYDIEVEEKCNIVTSKEIITIIRNTKDSTLNTNKEWVKEKTPKIPEDTNNTIDKCPKCGIILENVMGYVCSNNGCPIFPQITY